MSFSFIRAPAEGRLLCGELLRDTGAKNLLGCADGGHRAPFFGDNACTPWVLLVVFVLKSDVLKFIKR